MARTQSQIVELFQTLPQAQQRALAEQFYPPTIRGAFYESMTPEQRAQLDQSVAEADRGEGTEAPFVMSRLAGKFGFPRAA
ncbi:MAG: hypothetical protein ACOYLQ_12865 [Hyphomicrobiaceae bacterium]